MAGLGYQSFGTIKMPDRVVILDRDGVINEDSDTYIKGPEEWIPIPGSIEAIARLCHAGYRICVVTNQSGLSRGLYALEELDAMHRKMRDLVGRHGARIELIAFCPHLPDDGCQCRKPSPGLLYSVTARLGINPHSTTFIGDSLGDVKAARAAGMRPWLVRTGKGTRTLSSGSELLLGVSVFDDLSSAAAHLLEKGTDT